MPCHNYRSIYSCSYAIALLHEGRRAFWHHLDPCGACKQELLTIHRVSFANHPIDHRRTRAIARTSPAQIASAICQSHKCNQGDDKGDATTTHKLAIHSHGFTWRKTSRYEGRASRTLTMTASINSGSCDSAASTRFRPAKSIASLISIRRAFIAPIYLSPFAN